MVIVLQHVPLGNVGLGPQSIINQISSNACGVLFFTKLRFIKMDILNLNPIPAMLASVVGHIAVVYPVLIVVRVYFCEITFTFFCPVV